MTYQLLAEVTATALREQGVFGMQFHAGHVAFFLFPIGADAHVARRDTLDAAVLAEEHFCGGEAGVDFNAETLGLLRQPATDVTHGNDVVPVIVRGPGNKEPGQLDCPCFACVEEKSVLGDRGGEGRAFFLPVGEQLVQRPGLKHSARQNMCADLGALLDHANCDFLRFFSGELHDTASGCEPRGPGTDNHDVEFH